MVPTRFRPWGAAAVIAALAVRLGTAQTVDGTWVTTEDVNAAARARTATELFCSMGFRGEVDQEAGREALLSAAGGENILLKVLRESSTSAELSKRLAEEVSPGGIAVSAGGTVFAIVLLAWWFLCCWSACPCCKCCRCCRKRRTTTKPMKGVLLVAGAAITFGVVFAACFAAAGYHRAVDGFDNMACTAASMLNGTLGGQASPYFVGMMPLLNVFRDIEQRLDADASFMTGIRQQIASTAAISDSVHLASETLALLKDAFDTLPPEIASTKHKCQFCEVLSPALAEVVAVLDGGVGASLDAARQEVDAQLSPEMSKNLQETFRGAAAPLTQVKTLVRDTFGAISDTEQLMKVRGHLEGEGEPQTAKLVVAIVIVLALLLCATMMFAIVWFFLRETTGVSLDTTDDKGDPLPRYSKVTHRVACCTWCCGWFYAVLAFLLGGLVMALSMPLANVCLIMDGLNMQMIHEIGPALGMNLTGHEGEQIVDILDKCFVPIDRTSNPALMDILFFRDNATAPKVTLREKIVGQVKDQIESKFSDIDTKLGSSNASIAANPQVLTMVRMLSNPIDMLIVVDPDAGWQQDADYQGLFTQAMLRDAFPASVRCPDGVVGAEVPTVGGQTIMGVENFVSKLAAFGVRTAARADCADSVVCTTTDPAELAACNAGNRYVALKQQIRDLATFQCDVFLDPVDGVSDCDPLNMVGVYDPVAKKTTYTSACLFPDGTLRRKSKACGLSHFVTYVSDFAVRINKTMLRLDTTVEEVGSGISVGMRNLVRENILQPIDFVADGVTCGFIGQTYRRIIDGLCYQGVVGVSQIGQSYAGCGVMTLLVILLMYGLWRRTVDNINENTKAWASVTPAPHPAPARATILSPGDGALSLEALK